MKTTILRKLINLDIAQDKYTRDQNRFKAITDSLQHYDHQEVLSIFDSLKESKKSYDESNQIFKKLLLPKRKDAIALKKWLSDYGSDITNQGEEYSGLTLRVVRFADDARAITSTDKGERYSRSSPYSKNNATHIVYFNPDTAHLLRENQELIDLSRGDGLYIIDLCPIKGGGYSATWVRGKSKQIVSEKGYIAQKGNTIYHSIKSIEDARNGAERKFKLQKENSRDSLESKLKNAQTIEVKLVRKLTGWCAVGCQAWLDRYMDGRNSAPKSEIIEAANRAKEDGNVYAEKLLKILA